MSSRIGLHIETKTLLVFELNLLIITTIHNKFNDESDIKETYESFLLYFVPSPEYVLHSVISYSSGFLKLELSISVHYNRVVLVLYSNS
jgi:hypothetical protein